MPNHLCHQSHWSPSDIPKSWDNGHSRWVTYCERLHLSGLSIFSGRGPPYDPGAGPMVFQAGVSLVCLDLPEEVSQALCLPRRRSPSSLWSAWTSQKRSLRPSAFPGGGPPAPSGLPGPPGGGPWSAWLRPPGPPIPLVEIPLDCLGLPVEVPWVHLALQEVVLWVPR